MIAARLKLNEDAFGDADYVLISTRPPYPRTTILSYRAARRAPGLFIGPPWYVGPARFTPDGRSLILRRVVGEHEELYAVDRASGATRKLPAPFWTTRSIGGR
jgi:hypothetical protein